MKALLEIRDGIGDARTPESPSPQNVRLALPAGRVLALVARPGELERHLELRPSAHDLLLGERDDRGLDADAPLGPGAAADDLLERNQPLLPDLRDAFE